MSLIGRKPPTAAELDPFGYWSKEKRELRKLDADLDPVVAEIKRRNPAPLIGGSPMPPFPGPRTPRQLRSSVAKAKKSERIFTRAVHPKFGAARYDLHTIVVPGKRITIVGVLPPGHRYIGPRGAVNDRPMQIRRVFRMGDVALTHGHNLDYMGRIRGISAKQVKVVEHEGVGTGRDKVFHMSLYDFAEKNAFFDEAKSRKKNEEWLD